MPTLTISIDDTIIYSDESLYFGDYATDDSSVPGDTDVYFADLVVSDNIISGDTYFMNLVVSDSMVPGDTYLTVTGFVLSPETVSSVSSSSSGSPNAILIKRVHAESTATATLYRLTALTDCEPIATISGSSANLTMLAHIAATIDATSGSMGHLYARLPRKVLSATSGSSAVAILGLGVLANSGGTGTARSALMPILHPAPVPGLGTGTARASLPQALLVRFPLLHGKGTAACGLLSVPRTMIVYGILTDESDTPIVAGIIEATLDTSNLEPTVANATINSIVNTVVSATTTDGGNWVLELIPPTSIIDPINPTGPVPTYIFTLDALGAQPMIVRTTPFSYQPGFVSLTSLVQTNTTLRAGVAMEGFVYDFSGKPIYRRLVRAVISNAATDTLTGQIYTNADEFLAYTDRSGRYTLYLPPVSRLVPAGVTYLVIEQPGGPRKVITVPDTGGFVNSNIIFSSIPLNHAVTFDKVGPENPEIAANSTLGPASSLATSLDRLRWVAMNMTGRTSWAQLLAANPTIMQTNASNTVPNGDIAITGYASSNELLTNKITSDSYRHAQGFWVGASLCVAATIPASVMGDGDGYVAWAVDPITTNTAIHHPTTINNVTTTINPSSGLIGNQLTFNFAKPYTSSILSVNIFPADTYTASRWNVAAPYAIINASGFTIYFGSNETACGVYQIYYQITGV